MKKIILSLALVMFLWNGAFAQKSKAIKNEVAVTIDLVNVVDDKVMVSLVAPTFTTETATFHIPKTVPGTYSEDDYGRYVENVKAFDAKGKALPIAKTDVNTYQISNATKLAKVTYLVNDTYDTESGGGFGEGDDVFSPAGTNINAGVNFMLNTHGFIGYFKGKEEIPYKLTLLHPESLLGVSAMTDADSSATSDVFVMPKYANLVEMPIMYSKPDFTSFMVDDMEIIISVYSPTGKYTAQQITPNMENMMKAQKRGGTEGELQIAVSQRKRDKTFLAQYLTNQAQWNTICMDIEVDEVDKAVQLAIQDGDSTARATYGILLDEIVFEERNCL
jgi:hypothetical protein